MMMILKLHMKKIQSMMRMILITANFMKPTILMRDDSEENYFEEEYPGDEYLTKVQKMNMTMLSSPSDRKRKKRHPSEEPEYETGKRSDPRSRKRSGVLLQSDKKGWKALSRLTGFLLQQLSVLLIPCYNYFYYIILGVQALLWRHESIRKKVFLRRWSALPVYCRDLPFFEFIS